MLAPDRGTPLGVRTLVATLAGVALGLTWQPYGWWPLLVVALPAFTLAVRGQRPRRAFGLGYLFGLAMLTLAVSWLQVLGVWVAILLIAFEALFFGLLGIVLSLVGRLRWWPLAAAAAWVLVELAYARFPFGGFGWSRIAYAAVDTPLAGPPAVRRGGRAVRSRSPSSPTCSAGWRGRGGRAAAAASDGRGRCCWPVPRSPRCWCWRQVRGCTRSSLRTRRPGR